MKCETCNSQGWVYDPEGGTMVCPDCDGESEPDEEEQDDQDDD